MNTCFLIILCDEREYMHKVYYVLKNDDCLEEKQLCSDLFAELATYFMLLHFYLKEQLRQVMVIQTWVFADIFSKINKMIPSLKGNW